jgi:solute carrier family 44 (choline transporter-like protein), member 1
MQVVASQFAKSWGLICLMCIVALVFSYILLILFRYAINYVIWVIYIGLLLLLIAGSAGMIFLHFREMSKPGYDQAGPVFLIFGAFLGLFAAILGGALCYYAKKIKFVGKIFKESSKALVDVPMIALEPLLTSVALALTFFMFMYFNLLIESSGDLVVRNDDAGNFVKAEYVDNKFMNFVNYFNLIAFMWFTSFISGCQNFVIASTVTQWYFTHSKSKLNAPISRAFSHLLNFHIGSICLGSIVITIVRIVKMIFDGMKVRSMLKALRCDSDFNVSSKNKTNEPNNILSQTVNCCCGWVIETLDQILQYLIRNSLIIVAKDGTPLFTSGKKAFNLLRKNLLDVIALNQFGDFVLFVGKIFVVAITGLVGYSISNVSGGCRTVQS